MMVFAEQLSEREYVPFGSTPLPQFEEMIAKEELDVIDICLPTFLHKEYTIKALQTGHHVLCEKPMSLCYEDCVQMCETAKKMGKKLMVGQCNRFSAPHLLLKKYVDEEM